MDNQSNVHGEKNLVILTTHHQLLGELIDWNDTFSSLLISLTKFNYWNFSQALGQAFPFGTAYGQQVTGYWYPPAPTYPTAPAPSAPIQSAQFLQGMQGELNIYSYEINIIKLLHWEHLLLKASLNIEANKFNEKIKQKAKCKIEKNCFWYVQRRYAQNFESQVEKKWCMTNYFT